MPKLELRIPLLNLNGQSGKKTVKLKEPKTKKKTEGKAISNSFTNTPPMYKPPSDKEMHKSTVHSAARESTRKWVAGEITTKRHQENMRRAGMAMQSGPLAAVPSKRNFTGGKVD